MGEELIISEMNDLDNSVLEQLSNLLIRIVEDGASVGFLAPVGVDQAKDYWASVIEPGVILFIARISGELVGTVQLHLATKPNASHRAEIAKLMVHPSYRNKGVARILMQQAEKRASAEARTLLVLDTRAGDISNQLYQSMGYVEAGQIPHFAQSSNGLLEDTVIYYKAFSEGH